tara:strand:+ start:311 stop:484 length:174 start_codon:yes stop_codon:yes gene_type:complete
MKPLNEFLNENINSLPGKSPEEKLKKLLLSKNILPNSYHSKIDKLIKELVDEIEKSK